MLEAVLHHEDGRDQPQDWLMVEGGDGTEAGERDEDAGEHAPASHQRSSSTTYSWMRRASGASGLRARYFRKASIALSFSLLW